MSEELTEKEVEDFLYEVIRQSYPERFEDENGFPSDEEFEAFKIKDKDEKGIY